MVACVGSELPDTNRKLDARPGYLLVRAGMRVRQRYVNALSAIGLLPNQHVILSTLNHSGSRHQKELADQAGLDPGDIVAYLDGLEKDGYIERNRDPADRRRQIVSMTHAGVQILETADSALDSVEKDTFDCLNVAERKSLVSTLDKLYRNL